MAIHANQVSRQTFVVAAGLLQHSHHKLTPDGSNVNLQDMCRVEVVPYNPRWPKMFAAEALVVARVLGDELVAIHHIGSTAIPGIPTKPIIDLMAEARDIAKIDVLNTAFELKGYTPKGEYGIPGRRFFVKETDGARSHNLHIFGALDPQLARHLAFRDYMRTHPAEAAAYGRLKEELARRFPADIDAYCDGKDAL